MLTPISDGVSASSSETETETQYFSCQICFYTKNIIFFTGNIFLHEKHHFFTGNIGIYHRPSAFFMPLFSFFPFRSCGLDRVSLERDRDLWTSRPRPIKSGLETRPGLKTSITDSNTWVTCHNKSYFIATRILGHLAKEFGKILRKL